MILLSAAMLAFWANNCAIINALFLDVIATHDTFKITHSLRVVIERKQISLAHFLRTVINDVWVIHSRINVTNLEGFLWFLTGTGRVVGRTASCRWDRHWAWCAGSLFFGPNIRSCIRDSISVNTIFESVDQHREYPCLYWPDVVEKFNYILSKQIVNLFILYPFVCDTEAIVAEKSFNKF